MRITLCSLVALGGAVIASAAVTPRDGDGDGVTRVDHDKIETWNQTVLNDPTGQILLGYQPLLKVHSACLPYPVVTPDGKVSGGLKPTGEQSASCGKGAGQVYGRVGFLPNGWVAIMTMFYFPKNGRWDMWKHSSVHRHDFQAAIMYQPNLEAAVQAKPPVGIALSTIPEGVYVKYRTGDPEGVVYLEGTHPLLKYIGLDDAPHLHILEPTLKRGGTQPMVQWEAMPPAARDALSKADFGIDGPQPVFCPMIDRFFNKTILDAFDPLWQLGVTLPAPAAPGAPIIQSS